MSKLKIFIIIFALAAILLPSFVMAAPTMPLNVYFFRGEGCPHCAEEEKLLEQIKDDYPEVNVLDFEIWYDSDNRDLLKKVVKALGIEASGVPVTIIGNHHMVGYLNAETSGKKIISYIEDCIELSCPDVVAPILANEQPIEPENPPKEPTDGEFIFNLPLIGEFDAKSLSLPLLTIIIGGLDGFNPCAMWVLIFLITLLLGMKNKKRMWLLGLAFILASGIVYFLFLSAWLSLFLFIGFIIWVRLIIGAIAVGSGIYHLKEYFTNKDASCKVVKADKRTKIMDRLKAVTETQKFYLALGGIIAVAFAINLVELVCSAGLPAIYTNILASSDLPTWKYYLYLLLYIFIFMLDDMIIFVIAMVTLQATGMAGKYVRYSNLIGGIIILILGLLLILRPEWLMFS